MKFPTQPWMTTSAVQRLFAAIPESATCLRFVGGCVRDSLIGKEVQDVDLATSYKPQDITKFLTDAGIKVIPTGIEHGTVLAVLEGQGFEITTLRRDVETDGRRAVVAFTDSWEEDAARRDFTFNSLYLTQDGEVYDPWNGITDLKQGIVRFIGHATSRIQEDYLRILRYFRFYARFSKGIPDQETLTALRENAHGLEGISGERIHSELLRLLKNPDPRDSLEIMAKTGVLEILTQQKIIPQDFNHLIDFEQQHTLTPSPLTRLYALIGQDPMVLKWILKRYKFSGKESKWLIKLEKMLANPEGNLKILLHFDGAEHTLAWALCHAVSGTTLDSSTLQTIQNWKPKLFPITGKDLMAQGIKPGPNLGKELKRQERAWILDQK